jgi:thiamine biosynthesis lipoprotein
VTLVSPPLVSVRPIWGTVIEIEVRDPIEERALEPLWDWFERVDDLFSTWRPDSEITRLARGELQLEDTSAEVRVVLRLCAEMKHTSGGAFDIAFAALEGPTERPGHCAIDPTGLV